MLTYLLITTHKMYTRKNFKKNNNNSKILSLPTHNIADGVSVADSSGSLTEHAELRSIVDQYFSGVFEKENRR